MAVLAEIAHQIHLIEPEPYVHPRDQRKNTAEVQVKHRTPSVERLHDTPHISVLVSPVPKQGIVYTAYGGPGRKKRIKRT